MSSCGVGNWGGPKPGDPDNSVALSVRYVFGGFEISWTYPGINPHAVAHTILYRGTDSSFELAVERAVVSGNTYSDSIDNLGTYYYWIKIVSINGTENALIGPAVGVADTLRAQQIMQEITGRIDSGVLATALRNDIDKITLNYAELQAEIANRQIGETVFADLLNELRTDLDGTIAVIQTEQTTRQSADEALASQITTVAAVSTSNAAAISSEQTARIAADEAIAADVTNLYAENDANSAAISAEATARATADSAIANNVTTLFATTANQAALIASETTARTTADSAMATNITNLFTATNNNAAAISSEQTARTNADNALANSINTVQTSLGNQIASVQTNLQTQINTTNGVVTNIGALYTVRVTVNGLVGGFGIYNNGTTIQAGFDVDEFFVGKTNANKVKPFIITGGVVYIDSARIKDASIVNAHIENLTVGGEKVSGNAITNIAVLDTSFSGYHYPEAPSSYTNLTNGVTTIAITLTSGLFGAQKALFTMSWMCERDGGDDDNLDMRLLRSDGIVIGDFVNFQIHGGRRLYSVQFVDNNVLPNVTRTYTIQFYSRVDGSPFWYDITLSGMVLKK